MNQETDRSSSVDAVFDGLHGNIDLTDVSDRTDDRIHRLLAAPYLQRLRRIKQLGFVSQSFLSAEHNRYAHALGTMQMMREILQRTKSQDRFWKEVIQDIKKLFPRTGRSKNLAASRDDVHQHLLVAALLQDVGEFPYSRATGFVFSPSESTKQTVQAELGIATEQAKLKDLMTFALIFDPKYRDLLDGLDSHLLAFLIAGALPDNRSATKSLLALRQMIDGAIDADRLDYVYRDAFHTIGTHSRAKAVIDSIASYDERGPILNHVRPITDFLEPFRKVSIHDEGAVNRRSMRRIMARRMKAAALRA